MAPRTEGVYMTKSQELVEDQAALWNGRAGGAWVAAQAPLDTMFQPFEQRLVAAARAASASAVLDVGCGSGATTLALAKALGDDGKCLGIDVSAPLLELARERAARSGSTARFVCADAQRFAFEPATFDLVVSRFGVMFFDDSVAAFVNLRGAVRAGGQLCCFAWRSPAENPFMTTAERAAAPLLPAAPRRQFGGPGQFALADAGHVADILQQAGWADVQCEPVDVTCVFAAADLATYVTRLGPLGQVLATADEALRTQVVEVVLRAFEPYVQGDQVRFTAACWCIRACSAPA